jgi:hypothetical protein
LKEEKKKNVRWQEKEWIGRESGNEDERGDERGGSCEVEKCFREEDVYLAEFEG